MNIETYRCHHCQKKLFEANLRLLLDKKYPEPGEKPRIEHLCPRCKTLNIFTYDPANYITK